MKKRVLVIMLVLSLLISGSGIVAMAEGNYVAIIDNIGYSSLEAVQQEINKGNQGTVELQQDIDKLTVDGNEVYVDLNGHNIGNVTVTNDGTFYGSDSQTNDFKSESEADYGIIGTFTGNVQAAFSPEEDGRGYLMFSDNGANASFHYVELRITDMVLRPKNDGEEEFNPSIYYKCDFKGDKVVADNVESFGVALSLVGQPNQSNLKTECGYSKFTNFQPGDNGNPEQNTGTLLYGIMQESKPNLINKRNAGLPIYGRAYIKLADRYIFGNGVSRTLKEQTEAANQIWAKYKTEDQEELVALYETFEPVMKTWDLSGMKLAPYSYVVDDPYTWYEEYQKLPIANDKMTKAELRQLCVDFFRLQLSFQWTPNAKFYLIDGKRETTIEQEVAFKGMVYANEGSKITSDGLSYTSGAGNLYKVLNYYDKATGVLDLEAIRKDGGEQAVFNVLTSHCNWGAGWGWNRVSNANYLWGCPQYLPSHGAIPIGIYEWNEPAYYLENEDGSVADYGNDTEKIIKANVTGFLWFKDYQKIFKSYAVMQKADGLWSTPGWHVMMCSDEPVVAYKSNGDIDPENSYIYVIDQNATESNDNYYWGTDREKTNEDGYYLRNLGGIPDVNQDPSSPHYGKVGTPRSFQNLLDSCYVPFTIPELVDLESTEKDINGETELDNWNQYVANISSYRESYQAKYDVIAAAVAADSNEQAIIDAKKRFYQDALKMIDLCADSPSDVVAVESGTAKVSFASNLKPSGGKVTLDALCASSTTIRTNYAMSNFLVTIKNAQGETLHKDTPPVFTRNRSTSITNLAPTDKVGILNRDELSKYVDAGNSVTISVQLSTGQWIDAFTAELVQ